MKRLAPIASLAVILIALLPSPASAASRADCGRDVIDDWYDDGRIGTIYPLECYGSALERLPVDLLGPARVDIERAYEYAKRGKLAPSSAGQRAAIAESRAYMQWSAALRTGAARDPQARFANPPIEVLRRRLRTVERRYDVHLRRLYVRWPRQQAPYVIVSTKRPAALARAVPAILETSTQSGRRATIAPDGRTRDSSSRRWMPRHGRSSSSSTTGGAHTAAADSGRGAPTSTRSHTGRRVRDPLAAEDQDGLGAVELRRPDPSSGLTTRTPRSRARRRPSPSKPRRYITIVCG